MGTKYSSNTSTGYNSAAPSDDGSQTAANLVKWSTHKTKLADPIKNLADAINTSLVSAFDYSVRQITASDNTVAGDHMRCVEIASTVTTAVTVSLGDAATMTNVYRVFIKNSSAISQTVGRVTSGDTIDGTAANITIQPGGGVVLQTNSAASGYIIVCATDGAFSDLISSVVAAGSAVSLSTGTPKTVTSISLTAGDWDVTGVVSYTGNAATTTRYSISGISTTNNTLGANGTFSTVVYALAGSAIFSLVDPGTTVPTQRISLTSTTTVYLIADLDFSVNTAAAYGYIRARRVR